MRSGSFLTAAFCMPRRKATTKRAPHGTPAGYFPVGESRPPSHPLDSKLTFGHGRRPEKRRTRRRGPVAFWWVDPPQLRRTQIHLPFVLAASLTRLGLILQHLCTRARHRTTLRTLPEGPRWRAFRAPARRGASTPPRRAVTYRAAICRRSTASAMSPTSRLKAATIRLGDCFRSTSAFFSSIKCLLYLSQH